MFEKALCIDFFKNLRSYSDYSYMSYYTCVQTDFRYFACFTLYSIWAFCPTVGILSHFKLYYIKTWIYYTLCNCELIDFEHLYMCSIDLHMYSIDVHMCSLVQYWFLHFLYNFDYFYMFSMIFKVFSMIFMVFFMVLRCFSWFLRCFRLFLYIISKCYVSWLR